MSQAQGSTASTARLCSSSRTHAGHVPCPPLAARLSLSQRQGHFLRSAADSRTFTLRPPTRRPGASASGGHSSSSNNSSSGSATLAPVKFGGGGGGGNLSGSGRWLLPARSGLAASHLHNGSGGGQLPRTRRMVLLSAAAPAAEAAAEAGEAEVSVAFDNDGDDECTVLELFGRNDTEVLAEVTNVLTAVGVTVASAVINQQDGEGPVRDVFRVTDCNGNKLTPEQWPILKQQLLVALAGSVRSTKPSIFGMLAAADQASTLSALSNSGDPDALEHAAAEMSKAAARLVAIERNMLELSADDGADVAALATKQKDRIEAASLLERTLAAMEAMLTARRQVAIKAVEAVKPVVPDFMQPPPSVRTSGPAAGSGYEIILQGFNWESSKEAWYKKLSGQAADIAEAGFTAIWFPPPSDSVAPQGYLPRDLYDLNSKFGSEAELRDAISVFHEQGIKVIADIVINHRCAHYQGDDGKWNKFGGRLAWDKSAVCANNAAFGGTGGYKNADDYPAAPNIDHSQERIRKDISEWLLYLRKSIGFDGWRFDYTKGYDGRWIAEYVNATVPEMAFGEYWDTCSYTDGVLNYNQDSHRQRTVDWCDATGGTSAAFDFTLKGVLQEAVGRKEYWRLIDGQGRPPGVLGLWPSRAVTFLENHDTGSTLNHWPFPYRNLPEAYCYLLTHCGTPCVFYDHFYDSKLRTHILELVAIRRRHKIHAKSEIMVRKAYGELYAAIIDKKIAMKIGPGDWSPSKDGMDIGQKKWQLAHSGFQFAVWEAKFE